MADLPNPPSMPEAAAPEPPSNRSAVTGRNPRSAGIDRAEPREVQAEKVGTAAAPAGVKRAGAAPKKQTRAEFKAALKSRKKSDATREDDPNAVRVKNAWGSPINGLHLVFDEGREDDPGAYRVVAPDEIEAYRVLKRGDPHFSVPKAEFEAMRRPADLSAAINKLMPTPEQLLIDVWRHSYVVDLNYPAGQHATHVTRIARALQRSMPGGDEILYEAQNADQE